ncbi:5530_t:CDS:2, partial [Funneliformis mosseae]
CFCSFCERSSLFPMSSTFVEVLNVVATKSWEVDSDFIVSSRVVVYPKLLGHINCERSSLYPMSSTPPENYLIFQ